MYALAASAFPSALANIQNAYGTSVASPFQTNIIFLPCPDGGFPEVYFNTSLLYVNQHPQQLENLVQSTDPNVVLIYPYGKGHQQNAMATIKNIADIIWAYVKEALPTLQVAAPIAEQVSPNLNAPP